MIALLAQVGASSASMPYWVYWVGGAIIAIITASGYVWGAYLSRGSKNRLEQLEETCSDLSEKNRSLEVTYKDSVETRSKNVTQLLVRKLPTMPEPEIVAFCIADSNALRISVENGVTLSIEVNPLLSQGRLSAEKMDGLLRLACSRFLEAVGPFDDIVLLAEANGDDLLRNVFIEEATKANRLPRGTSRLSSPIDAWEILRPGHRHVILTVSLNWDRLCLLESVMDRSKDFCENPAHKKSLPEIVGGLFVLTDDELIPSDITRIFTRPEWVYQPYTVKLGSSQKTGKSIRRGN